MSIAWNVPPNRRSRVTHPGTPNARVALGASAILVLISGAQLLMFDRTNGGFFPNFVDVTVILAGIASFFYALRHMGTITIPAESPCEFSNYGVVLNALKYQSIYGKDNVIISKPGPQHFLLGLIPEASLVSMSPWVRNIAIQQAAIGAGYTIVTVALIIWAVFWPSSDAVPYVSVGLAYTAFYLWTMWYFRHWGGILTTRHLKTMTLDSAGHPRTLFQLLENRVRSVHGNAGPIRMISKPPEMESAGVQDTGTFDSYVLYELPPEVTDGGPMARFGIIVAPAACLGMVAGVWLLHSGAYGGRDFTYYFCVAAGLWLCWSALSLAWRLDTRFRFLSQIILITLDGTFFRSSVTVGRSLYDSHESQNTAVRSDIRVNFYASELLSETSGMLDPRELAGAQATERAAGLIGLFTADAERFQHKGVGTLGLDFGDAAADINRYNLGAASARAAIQPPPAGVSEPGKEAAPPQPPPEIEQGGETKTCPDCAESVKRAARKCRYCGHIFED